MCHQVACSQGQEQDTQDDYYPSEGKMGTRGQRPAGGAQICGGEGESP